MHVSAYLRELDRHYIDIDISKRNEEDDGFVDIKRFQYENDDDYLSCTKYKAQDFAIVDTRMKFSEKCTDIFKIDGEHIMLDFVFKGEVYSHSNFEEGGLEAEANSHNISYRNALKGVFDITGNVPMGFLSIILSKDFFKKLTERLPVKDIEFLHKISCGREAQLFKNYIPITPEIQLTLNQIRGVKLSPFLISSYLETKISELLLLQIDCYYKISGTQRDMHLNEDDIKKLHLAKNLLDNNYVEAPSLRSLCMSVGLNEFKIKKGFRQLFGTPVKGYIISLRMNYALELLKTGSHLINDIAIMCGYNSLENFSAAFKKYYGCSPKKCQGAPCIFLEIFNKKSLT